jgi:Mg2+ and Co2+ transporter CorA
MKQISANKITWIDIVNPSEKDLSQIKDKYKVHPLIESQFLPPIHRPKIE